MEHLECLYYNQLYSRGDSERNRSWYFTSTRPGNRRDVGESPIRSNRLVLPLLFLGLLAARLCHTNIVWVEEAYPTAAAIQILDGKSLYQDVWFDKPPLSACAYLLWGARIGVPLRIVGAIFVFLCCLLLWRFARDLWGPREGLAAAL